jgi:hypothetical protein
MNAIIKSNPNIEIFFIHGKKCLNKVMTEIGLSKELIYKHDESR